MEDRLTQYLAYLERHRRFVLEEAVTLGVADRGLRHDLSKYEPDEFDAYAAYFYGDWRNEPTWVQEEVRQHFDRAWLLHQKRNEHHWQYWVLREDDGATKALLIPEPALREMLADWRGAGRAILGDKADTAAWYAKNRERIILHPESRAWIEAHLSTSRS
jgi:hypothetical protein